MRQKVCIYLCCSLVPMRLLNETRCKFWSPTDYRFCNILEQCWNIFPACGNMSWLYIWQPNYHCLTLLINSTAYIYSQNLYSGQIFCFFLILSAHSSPYNHLARVSYTVYEGVSSVAEANIAFSGYFNLACFPFKETGHEINVLWI